MSPADNDKLHQALALHKARRLAESEELYRQILASDPRNADALHLLGAIHSERSQHELALQLIEQAIAMNPAAARFHVSRGSVLAALGRGDEAIASCRRAAELTPNNTEIENNIGTVYTALGKIQEAEAAFRRAVALAPGNTEMQFNLGIVLRMQNKTEEAITAFQRAAELRPEHVESQYQLGKALISLRRPDEAIAALEQAIRARRDYAEAHAAIGDALRLSGRFERAVSAYRAFCDLRPDAHWGKVLLGRAMQENGQLDDAIALLREVLVQHADSAEAHVQLGAALLLRGELTAGWNEYMWIWERPDPKKGRRRFSRPRWKAGPVAERRMFVHSEAGFGDAIMLARYVPLLAERAASVVFESPVPLRRLFESLRGRHRLITRGEPIPEYDLQCPMMHIPAIFGTTLETIPANVPYLSADSPLVDEWRKRLGNENILNVGLVWAGDPQSLRDRLRTIALPVLAPLAGVPGVRFISLQKGPAAKQAASPPAGMNLIDWTAQLGDFADSAALIANLDLVITVDTAAAHLAGAMGKPVWVLLSLPDEWRWLIARPDSPWYPTMRLFRQQTMGDWAAPVQEVADALRSLSQSQGASRS